MLSLPLYIKPIGDFHTSQALPSINSDLCKTLSSLTRLPHQGNRPVPSSARLVSIPRLLIALLNLGAVSNTEAFGTKLLLGKNPHRRGVTNVCS